MREYKSGKYEQALKEYEKLIQRKNDDPRLRFNAGTAAYRNRQFDEAAKQFDEAVTAPDLQLQEKAYYNRGNTFYHLGEAALDPNAKTETWKKAVQDYENSLRLDPQDADAKFNYEFVKKRIEELKQQQQKNQQNKSDKNEDQNQDQQQQQQQNESKEDKKQDQQQQNQSQNQQQKQEQEQNKPDQKKDSSKQNQNQDAQQKQEQEQKQQQAKQDQQKKDEKKQQQAKQAKQSKDKPEEESQEQQAAVAAGQMTPEQALQLLDAQKGDDQWMPSKPNTKPTEPNKPVKDW